MKKTLTLMIAIVSLCSLAQVRVATPAKHSSIDDILNETVKYDSTKNVVLSFDTYVRGLKGQDMYIIPGSDISEYTFKKFLNGHSTKIENTSQLYGKVFHIDSVYVESPYKYSTFEYNYLVLSSKDYPDTVVYRYPDDNRTRVPFLMLGYKEKMERKYRDKSFVLIGRLYDNHDFNTGAEVDTSIGTIWSFSEIVISSETNDIAYLYKNNSGNYIAASPEIFMSQSEYNELIIKYGKQMCYAAFNRELKVGMPMSLVRIAWGSPSEKRSTSLGDVWTYKKNSTLRYVYFSKTDKVRSWI